MAALRSFLAKPSALIGHHRRQPSLLRSLMSTEAAAADPSADFAQRLRDLPKLLPGTKIKPTAQQVLRRSTSIPACPANCMHSVFNSSFLFASSALLSR
ncbi:hypothetical protein LINGRAHAP2_LOCUS253 [Linum grandiflorum]